MLIFEVVFVNNDNFEFNSLPLALYLPIAWQVLRGKFFALALELRSFGMALSKDSERLMRQMRNELSASALANSGELHQQNSFLARICTS